MLGKMSNMLPGQGQLQLQQQQGQVLPQGQGQQGLAGEQQAQHASKAGAFKGVVLHDAEQQRFYVNLGTAAGSAGLAGAATGTGAEAGKVDTRRFEGAKDQAYLSYKLSSPGVCEHGAAGQQQQQQGVAGQSPAAGQQQGQTKTIGQAIASAVQPITSALSGTHAAGAKTASASQGAGCNQVEL